MSLNDEWQIERIAILHRRLFRFWNAATYALKQLERTRAGQGGDLWAAELVLRRVLRTAGEDEPVPPVVKAGDALMDCGHPRSSMVYADDLYQHDEPGAICTCYCGECARLAQEGTR
jgi:hypothetical protein